MANLQKTTKPGSRHKNSCPDGWLNAGAKVPIRLTVRQEEYCRQAIDIHRFCYNLAVRTHRFLPPQPAPLAQLAGHQQGLQRLQAGGPPLRHPGRSRCGHRRLQGLRPGRGKLAQPCPQGPGPKNQASDVNRHRLLPGGGQHEGNALRRKAEDETPLPGQRQAGLHPAQGHLLRGQHQEGERPVVRLPEALEATGAQRPERDPRPGGIDTGINPLGTDSDGQVYRESQSLLPGAEETPEMAAGPGPETEGIPGLVGSPAQDRQVPPAHPGPETQRAAPDDQHGDQEIQ